MKKIVCLAALALVFGACGFQKKDASATQAAGSADSIAVTLKDYGAEPTVLNIEAYTEANENFRTVLWTGSKLQVTLMTIPVGGDVGLELHPNIDQFLRIESGQGRVLMGDAMDKLSYTQTATADHAVFVPAGKWHNLVNTGSTPLKLYSIYAPVEHPHGTVHKTQEEAEEAE
jgi:mannose-6-phosphate isomerase-like protein (cupin superfamily)